MVRSVALRVSTPPDPPTSPQSIETVEPQLPERRSMVASNIALGVTMIVWLSAVAVNWYHTSSLASPV